MDSFQFKTAVSVVLVCLVLCYMAGLIHTSQCMSGIDTRIRQRLAWMHEHACMGIWR